MRLGVVLFQQPSGSRQQCQRLGTFEAQDRDLLSHPSTLSEISRSLLPWQALPKNPGRIGLAKDVKQRFLELDRLNFQSLAFFKDVNTLERQRCKRESSSRDASPLFVPRYKLAQLRRVIPQRSSGGFWHELQLWKTRKHHRVSEII